MKPADYFKLSARTLTPPQDAKVFELNWHRVITTIISEATGTPENEMVVRNAHESITMLHGLLGIIGEMGELEEAIGRVNRAEVVKEFGDIWWYVAALCRGARWSFDDFVTDVVVSVAEEEEVQRERISLRVNGISEPYKKWIFYGKQIDNEELLNAAIKVMVNATRAAMLLGVTIAEAQAFNIEKLRKRYPDKFDEAAAVAKADEG